MTSEREPKLEQMLGYLIEHRGYARNRQAVANAVFVSTSALSQYMSGKARPSFDKLLLLARFFNVSLDYLVYGEQSTPAPAVDIGPLARYIDHSLNHVQAMTSRRIALTTRIGQVLVSEIETAASRLAEKSAASAGQLDDDDTLRLESFALSFDLVTMNLAYDIVDTGEPGSEAAGRFLAVVADNLARGCKHRYLLPPDGTDWTARANAARRLLANLTTGDVVNANLAIRVAKVPLFAGVGLYALDLARLQREAPLLYEMVKDYVDDAGRLGYVIPPSKELLADSLMDSDHLHNALESFEQIWPLAEPI